MHYKYCAECDAALIGVHQCCPNGCIQPPGEHIKIQNQNDHGPIQSRIADRCAHLIAENERLWGVIDAERERAEKAEREVERLQAEVNVMREGAMGLLQEHVSLDIAAKQAQRLYAENQQMKAVVSAACELHKFLRSTIGEDGAPLELTSSHPDGDVYMAGAADRLTALYDALKAHPLVRPEMYLESTHPDVLEEQQ